MADVDTSAEAVERRADELLGWLTGPDSGQNDGITETVRVLRALRAALTQAEAERDALQTRLNFEAQANDDAVKAFAAVKAERDKARAAATRWEKAAVLAALPLEAMIMAGTTRLHAPEIRKQIDAGIGAVRAALGDNA